MLIYPIPEVADKTATDRHGEGTTALPGLPPRTVPASVIAVRRFKAVALFLGERLDLRARPPEEIIATNPMTVAVRGGGVGVLFRHGVIVLFGVPDDARAGFLDTLQPAIGGRYDRPETDEVEIRIDPATPEGMKDDALHLESLTIERLQVVADILGKSVVLAMYESCVGQSFDRIEPLARELEQRGRLACDARHLLKQIGTLLLSEQTMMARAEITEKPETLWDYPSLEGLFLRFEDEFEIRERSAVMERKLKFIAKTVRTLLELVHSRQSLRVEWYIVLLIVGEIMLTVYTMLAGVHA